MLISIAKKFIFIWFGLCALMGLPLVMVMLSLSGQAQAVLLHRLLIASCLMLYPVLALFFSLLLTIYQRQTAHLSDDSGARQEMTRMMISMVNKFILIWGGLCLTLWLPLYRVGQQTAYQVEFTHRLLTAAYLVEYPLVALVTSIFLTLLVKENGVFRPSISKAREKFKRAG